MNAIAQPRFVLSSSQLELLKWIGLVAMFVDHANTVLFAGELGPVAAVVGRLAFPLFAIVFGYNLARPGVDPLRVAWRVFLVGCLATVVYVPTLGVWPLNVLFTLAASAVAVRLLEANGWLAWSFVLLVGCLVDYLHFGVLLVLASWMFFRGFGPVSLIVAGAAFGGIAAVVNHGAWALLGLPVVYLVSRTHLVVTRWRWAFLVAYPAHLAVLYLVARV